VGIGEVCRLFGKSRQAYYQLEKRRLKGYIAEEIVVTYVRGIRTRQPRMGTRKLYCLLKAVMKETGIKMGRDKFFSLLRTNDLLVKPRRRRIKTTDSKHMYRKYPNIIKGYEPCGPEQIWSSDITFITTEKGFVYVSLVTDQYSKKIMGYHIHPTLEAEGSLKALRMALKNRSHRETKLIHHSDRGIQYCCGEYIALLERNGIQISMSAPGNPCENAVAERVNSTVKTEFFLNGYFRNIEQVQKALKETVSVYNSERPHASCDFLTPDQAHQQQGVLKKRWRTYKPKVQPQKIDAETQRAVDQLIAKSI
jgi:transposase InsO family protein